MLCGRILVACNMQHAVLWFACREPTQYFHLICIGQSGPHTCMDNSQRGCSCEWSMTRTGTCFHALVHSEHTGLCTHTHNNTLIATKHAHRSSQCAYNGWTESVRKSRRHPVCTCCDRSTWNDRIIQRQRERFCKSVIACTVNNTSAHTCVWTR